MASATSLPTHLNIRTARPEDRWFIAVMTYEAMIVPLGTGLFDNALTARGLSPVSFLTALLETGANNWIQLENYLVAEDAFGLVGTAGSFAASQNDWRPLTPAGMSVVGNYLRWDQAAQAEFWHACVKLVGDDPAADLLRPPADYIIEYVGIRADRRGQGIVGQLLDAHVRSATGQGFTSIGISAMTGNDAALHAYRKFGFEIATRLTAEDYGGAIPGVNKLRMPRRPLPTSDMLPRKVNRCRI